MYNNHRHLYSSSEADDLEYKYKNNPSISSTPSTSSTSSTRYGDNHYYSYNYGNNYDYYKNYTDNSTPKITFDTDKKNDSYSENKKTSDNNKNTSEDIEKKRKEHIVRGLSGLKNMGNTCYLNSIIQCLSSIDYFRSWLIKNKYQDRLYNNVVDKLGNEQRKKLNIDKNQSVHLKKKAITEECDETIVHRLAEVLETMWKQNCTVSPKSLKSVIGKNCSTFSGYNQNDSQEVLSLILDRIHEETKAEVKLLFPNLPNGVKEFMAISKDCSDAINDENVSLEVKEQKTRYYKEYKKTHAEDVAIYSAYIFWKKHVKNSHSIIIDLFTGLFYSKITCSECNNISSAFEPFNILSIPTKEDGETTLDDCLNEFTKEEILTGENKYFCDECNKKVDARKKMYIWEPPIIMLVQLKRFKNDNWRTTKTTSKVVFPIENLNIEPYLSELHKPSSTKYNLVGISQHTGSTTGGHYVACCKNGINNKWYEFDDDDIMHIPFEDLEKEIITKNAYILFYVRNTN